MAPAMISSDHTLARFDAGEVGKPLTMTMHCQCGAKVGPAKTVRNALEIWGDHSANGMVGWAAHEVTKLGLALTPS